MLCFERLVSFLESLFSTILQNCRILIPVSNFYRTSPDCRKRSNAVFSLQHRLDLPCSREVRCLAFLLDVSVPCVQLSLCVQICPQVLYNLLFAPHSTPRRLSFPFRSVHRFRPSLHTPHVCAYPPSTLIRSFPCSKTDRPSRTFGICRWQNCRS